jgi:arylsulfatase A-like enzyme
MGAPLKIVLDIISSLRTDHLGAYGNSWLRTDGFNSLANAGRISTAARCTRPDAVSIRMEILTGLDYRRFTGPSDPWGGFQAEFMLPGRLRSMGYQTVLLTDNFSVLPLYERLGGFETILYIPGQGADPHVSDIVKWDAGADENMPAFNVAVSGDIRRPTEEELDRYTRNQACARHLGHPSVRLFKALNSFVADAPGENWFLLVDSFGLQPPWDAPSEFRRYRGTEDTRTLAWPLAGPVNPAQADVLAQLNVLRRAYADSCLFIDHLVGSISAEGITLVVASDHGVLIGDENYLLGRSDQSFPSLVQQVLITRGPGVEPGSRNTEPVAPVDLYATLLAKAGQEPAALGDGKVRPLF